MREIGRIATALLAVSLFTVGGASSASDQALLDLLVEKGIVSESERDGLLAEAARRESQTSPAHPPGKLAYTTEDDAFEWVLDGRFQADTAFYLGDNNNLSNGYELRRGRLGVKTRLWEHWGGELDFAFEDAEVEVKDAFLSYSGLPGTLIKVGQFKEPFSLEEVTSSALIVFMERALPNVLAPGRHAGIGAEHSGEHWRFAYGFFGQEFDDVDEGLDTPDSEGWGASARLTGVPIDLGPGLLHLGVSAAMRRPDSDDKGSNRVRFRTRSETHVERERLLSTGRISDVNRWYTFGAEAAASVGPVLLQGEYIRTEVDRGRGLRDPDFDGWYAMASWMITGERRPYDSRAGEFGEIYPRRKSGAWEVAARYSTVDLNDRRAGIEGGAAYNTTLGLNWYPNRNVRMMFNWVRANHDDMADADGDLTGDDDFDILQTRVQFRF